MTQSSDLSILSLVERQLHDFRGVGRSLEIDVQSGAFGGEVRVDVRHRDALLQCWAERAARHFAHDLAALHHGAALPRDSPALELEPDELALRASLRDLP